MIDRESINAKVTSNSYGICFCSNCSGAVWQIMSESKYCFRCGAKLDWSGVNKNQK